MPHADLSQFNRDYRLKPRHAATLFGVAPSTERRWRRTRRIPQHAMNMIDVVREQTPPINSSLHRGPSIGVLIWSWRERFFGPDWKSWMPGWVKDLYTHQARVAHEREQLELERANLERSRSMRRYYRRRRASSSSR